MRGFGENARALGCRNIDASRRRILRAENTRGERCAGEREEIAAGELRTRHSP
jgi:hypothetical protein